MEDRIGEVLAPLRGQIETLARNVTAGEGWVARAIRDWDRRRPLERLFPAKEPGPDLVSVTGSSDHTVLVANPPLLANSTTLEAGTAEVAVARGTGGDDFYLPMMSPTILAGLVSPDGPVQPGSFTWVVWAHYMTALRQNLIAQQEVQYTLDAVLAATSKITAILSLTLLFTPVAPLAAVARVLGVGVMALQAYTVVNQLATLDEADKDALASVDPNTAATLAVLGGLLANRSEYLDQVTTAVFTELILIATAGAVPQFGLLLHVRGYYYDLEALLEG